MKKRILFLAIMIIFCSFEVQGAGIICGDGICSAPTETAASCPKDCALTTIAWPTGILGHCPTTGGYKACCYKAGTSGICGLTVGSVCMPDASIFTLPSYMFLVKYSTDSKANQGRCATVGPKMNYPRACYTASPDSVIDATNHTVECIDPIATTGTTLNSTYCTSLMQAKKTLSYADLDGKALSAMQPAPMTLKCKSFYEPSGIEYGNVELNKCMCPSFDSCKKNCLPSYYQVAAPVTVTAATCSDGYLNNLETDVDCGGNNCRVTKPCANGKKCSINTDCLSRVCTGGICQAPTCTDGAKNQDETDIDCGGLICQKCIDKRQCLLNADCLSDYCFSNICKDRCANLIHDGLETYIDCGGPVCPACANEMPCIVNSDCASNFCDSGTCKDLVATCDDNVKNQDETDIDCGGATCTQCTEGLGCLAGTDCESNSCIGSVCQPATCIDGIKNQDETGIDCGGTECEACQDCTLAVKAWTDLNSLDKTEIAKGLPIYVLLVGANCEGVTADYDVKQVAGDASAFSQPGIAFVIDSDSGSHYSILKVDTSALGGDYYYTANIHRASGDEMINSKAEPNGILTVTGECYADEPGACADSTLPEDDITRMPNAEGKYPDADCDGIADCIDTYLYGTEGETLSYIEGNVGGCTGSWDCSRSEWSECEDANGELISTRVVRDCAIYTNNCCIPPEGRICTPPPSRKVCIDEEEFPMFSWMNALLVLFMLISFYKYKKNN